MPKRAKTPPIYHRGGYSLDWDRGADGSLRSPFLAVFWYDAARRRIRSASTGTGEVEAGRKFLDALYLQNSQGEAVCHACGQPLNGHRGSVLLATAIDNYLATEVDDKASADAIRHRLAHVVTYLATLPSAAVTCDQVDEAWVARFRKWAIAQPIVSPTGKTRDRSASTVENSVLQLQAVVNAAHRRGDTRRPAQFRPVPPRQVNRTPRHRAGVGQLAAMFNFCLRPKRETGDSDKLYARRIRDRAPLHRFLMISVTTLARPDAAHDFSLEAKRAQWDPAHDVIDLNPRGRAQTRKHRATVWTPYQLRPHLDGPKGYFVGPASVKKAWEAMATELNLPGEGEGGMKLIRRSMAQLLRRPDLRVPVEQVELQLGHRAIDSTSELYAPFQPDYLPDAKRALETIVDEIESLAPGAFHRSNTGEEPSVVPIKAARNAS